MRTGGFNSFGDRTYYRTAKYWKYDKTNKDLEKLVHETAPAGTIEVKEKTTKGYFNQEVGSFMFVENNVTLETRSNNDLRSRDIVVYLGDTYNVVNVQKSRVKRNSQYLDVAFKYTITLKR